MASTYDSGYFGFGTQDPSTVVQRAYQYTSGSPVNMDAVKSFMSKIPTKASDIFYILFLGSAISFMIFFILFVIDYTMYPIFSFSAGQPGLIPVPIPLDKSIAYNKFTPSYDLSAAFVPTVGLQSDSYSFGMDIWLTGDFMLSNMPRVILYRASKENIPKTQAEAGKDYPDMKSKAYKDTNIIVWLDPHKNDLFVSAVTATDTLITVSAENVPVRTVFRAGIVFSSKFLELYINGKLAMSIAITQVLRCTNETTTRMPFYPTIQPILNNVVVRNLTFWPRILTANEIRANEGRPISTSQDFI
jgi:hypothetical protein